MLNAGGANSAQSSYLAIAEQIGQSRLHHDCGDCDDCDGYNDHGTLIRKPIMLDTLAALAKRSRGLQPFAYGVAAASVAGFLISLISGDSGSHNPYLVPSIVGFLWSLIVVLLASLFSRVPPIPSNSSGRLARLKSRFWRLLYHLASVFFVLLTGAVLITSYRLLSIWLSVPTE
ncbi:hypothetical protein N9R09_01390 [Porticoccaceae bacterium]|nr:hypothetical protein [Porticoccaceae bacterium]